MHGTPRPSVRTFSRGTSAIQQCDIRQHPEAYHDRRLRGGGVEAKGKRYTGGDSEHEVRDVESRVYLHMASNRSSRGDENPGGRSCSTLDCSCGVQSRSADK